MKNRILLCLLLSFLILSLLCSCRSHDPGTPSVSLTGVTTSDTAAGEETTAALPPRGPVWSCSGGTLLTEEGGKLTLKADAGNALALCETLPPENYRLDITLKLPAEGTAGILLGASPESGSPSGYKLELSAAEHFLRLAPAEGEEHIGKRTFASVNADDPQELTVEVNGDILRVTLHNDAEGVEPWPEFEVRLPSLSGRYGLFTTGGGVSAEPVLTEGYLFPICEGETYTNHVCYGYADPDILYYDGTYYMYATSSRYAFGYEVYTSADLVHWKDGGRCAMMRDICGYGGFWAPDVEYLNGRFYMVVTSDMAISVAVSDSPLGPFVGLTGHDKEFLADGIDGHLFADDDGRIYLYYAGIRVMELNGDLTEVISAEPVQVLAAGTAYENGIVEAPYVLKHNGLYYMIYSGNACDDPDYCICYAVSDSPLGPFVRYENNPILIRCGDKYGVGHCSFAPSPDGSELFMIYHCHESAEKMGTRSVCIDRVRFAPSASGTDILEVCGPTALPQPIPSSEGSGSPAE